MQLWKVNSNPKHDDGKPQAYETNMDEIFKISAGQSAIQSNIYKLVLD